MGSTFLTFGLGIAWAERKSPEKWVLGFLLGFLGLLIATLVFSFGLAGIFYIVPRAFEYIFGLQLTDWGVQL
jgi:hypothetical protein